MSAFGLDLLFRANSLALVGGSVRMNSLGAAILENILRADFRGSLHVVNPNHKQIIGRDTVPSLSELPETPDIVVVTAPPAEVPRIIDAASK